MYMYIYIDIDIHMYVYHNDISGLVTCVVSIPVTTFCAANHRRITWLLPKMEVPENGRPRYESQPGVDISPIVY